MYGLVNEKVVLFCIKRGY